MRNSSCCALGEGRAKQTPPKKGAASKCDGAQRVRWMMARGERRVWEVSASIDRPGSDTKLPTALKRVYG